MSVPTHCEGVKGRWEEEEEVPQEDLQNSLEVFFLVSRTSRKNLKHGFSPSCCCWSHLMEQTEKEAGPFFFFF